ncbi:fibronectin type III domain-containing protein [Streptomyces sp. NPDC002506]|uniref:fibronectin type III domain-containing protein n=1 Tax=Streptomyces sp. NPDC002506 TaxID=3154536 RepID=UPI003323BBCD
MSRKRGSKKKVFVWLAGIAAAGAMVPLASYAVAGQEGLTAKLEMGGSTTWWSSGAFNLANQTSSPAADWTLEFDTSAGKAQVNSSWTATGAQDGRHVTIKATRHGTVPNGGKQRIEFGIQGDGKDVPEISGCKLNGESFPCKGGDETDREPPTAPTKLTGQAQKDGTIRLGWGASHDNRAVVNYEVFDKGKKIYATAADRTDAVLTKENAGIKPNTPYELTVKAVDGAGNVSAASNVLKVTTGAAPAPDNEPPTAPKNVKAIAGGSQSVRLTWGKSTDNVGVTGYRVYLRGTKEPLQTTGPDTPAAVVSGLKPSTKYTFEVKAVDAAGNESAAGVASATTTAEDKPVGGTAPKDLDAKSWIVQDGPGVHYLGLTWDVPQGQKKILRYEVYLNGEFTTTVSYYDPDTATSVQPGPAKGGKAIAEITLGDHPEKTYKVKVRAVLDNGSPGAFSEEKTVSTT